MRHAWLHYLMMLMQQLWTRPCSSRLQRLEPWQWQERGPFAAVRHQQAALRCLASQGSTRGRSIQLQGAYVLKPITVKETVPSRVLPFRCRLHGMWRRPQATLSSSLHVIPWMRGD